MTKIAIISDIHGNSDALSAVVSEAQDRGVTEYISCGDYIGYYYDTDTVIDILQNLKAHCCRGNHEDIFEIWQNGSVETRELLKKKYGSSYQIADKVLSQDKMLFLKNLPHPLSVMLGGINFLISHGSPWDINERIYPDASHDTLEKFDEWLDGHDVILTGHTHYRQVWRRAGKVIVNPGSVGQPRAINRASSTGRPVAHWALYDCQNKDVELCQTFYNADNVIKSARLYDPHLPMLQQVLRA
jgi:putative phosphoesterase